MRIFKAEFFKALANPVRKRSRIEMRTGEKSVNDLAASIQIEQAGVSQHLAILRAKHLVKNRKKGNSVYYSIADPAIFVLLDDAARIFKNNLIDLQGLVSPAENPSMMPAPNE
ncbi:transcriptional regulator [bacterium (Candidatus Blackallbacteria) CG17_big_fil_post_rev_8_21_14_2_50_48_46]|uniref:Transcriptional regulator n=1 Tax=bacterium (Candidatus Blackallbacteria) CG17_big_fil_post_rev_8_21_14_2_50_48_46 TaxID=2014261 RepID=A0A2M7G181_9BACT|nr:MAG: transcriptional regulator [bacterium (Candidatus Blackallbacteria) CG18_big_fil_WC_8_21_14_2_50_49_26]PIW15455.1 MAG: transcriptional regulator [bacterium (Candidatus Blackallbacteria) CG17_big_fil_post_rev_8_21_14_2_50_48_46]PIW45262.1 MAG: transcriptional regulator [bacterium (Candidatus Blackallbacteria) CG13_big_fil_rev_8_21_14_2_50_49_14]